MQWDAISGLQPSLIGLSARERELHLSNPPYIEMPYNTSEVERDMGKKGSEIASGGVGGSIVHVESLVVKFTPPPI